MSHLRPMPSPMRSDEAAQRTAWRFFPLAVVLGLVIVVVVNGIFVWIALSTFPGAAVHNSFEHSNNYDQAIAASEREAALGWTVRAEVAASVPEISIADSSGQPLAGAHIEAIAKRPLGADHTQNLAFAEPATPGRYVGDRAALAQGQWDLLVTVRRGSEQMHVTRRVLVK